MDQILYSGGDRSDFVVGTDCFPDGNPSVLKRGRVVLVKVVFTPRKYGARTATLSIVDSAPGSPQQITLTGNGTEGYFLAGSRAASRSSATRCSTATARTGRSSAPIISITTTTTGAGYWLLGADGGIFSFGNAKFFGSTGAMHLNQPVVGMASRARRTTATGSSPPTAGSSRSAPPATTARPAGMHLNQPIVGMAATRSGKGYWLVAARRRDLHVRRREVLRLGRRAAPRAADRRHGVDAVGQRLLARRPRRRHLHVRRRAVLRIGRRARRSAPIVGMAPTPDGAGYWMSNTVGQVFKFGDAPYFGDLYPRGIDDRVRDRADGAARANEAAHARVMRRQSAGTLNASVVAEAGQRAARAPDLDGDPRRGRALRGSAGRRGVAA